MIVVANRIPVAEGYEAAFEERFQNRDWSIKACPGFIRTEVLKPLQGACYVVMTYWEDRTAFENWTHSEAFRKAHADRPPREMFSGPNVLEIHEVINSTDDT